MRIFPSLPLACWVRLVSSGSAIAITVCWINSGTVDDAARSVIPFWRKTRRVERFSNIFLLRDTGVSPVRVVEHGRDARVTNNASTQLILRHRNDQLDH